MIPDDSWDGRSVVVGPYDGSAAEWDGFVTSLGGANAYTHCHLYGWRDVMQRAMRHEAPYLAARDTVSGALRGVLPLVRVRSRLLGHFLVSMPFLNYGGPLGDADAVRALCTSAATMAARDRARLLELRSRNEIVCGEGFSVSHRKITVLLDTSGGSDALWKRLPSKVRSQVRRPMKDGIEVAIGAAQVQPFYTVFSRHMRVLGTPVMPRRFFELAAAQFRDSALFAVAYHKGEPVACGGGFLWGDGADREFEIVWASSLREYNRMAPNMLVYWELMKHVADAGIGTFNFGRCTPGGNTHRFKQQWVTRDQPLWWYDHSPGGAAPLAPDATSAQAGAALWRRLPLPIANALGPRIARLIPL